MLTEKRNLVFKKLVTQWWELGTFLRSYPEKSFPSTQGFQFFSYRWLCGDLFVFFLRDGPLEKLWGGRGIFEPQEFFFLIKFLVWIFFRPQHEYFLWLIGLQEFFSFNLPLREFFFGTSPAPPPPHKFSNGPSLMKLLVLRESRSLPFELIIVDSQWLFK